MTGAGWTSLGTWGSEVNQFSSPAGLFADGAGRIYVADFGNSRVVWVNYMNGAGWVTLGTAGAGSASLTALLESSWTARIGSMWQTGATAGLCG